MTENIWANTAEAGNRASILLVDDEQSVLDALRRQLHSQFKVVTALDGQTGLQLVRSDGPFAVIVSDMQMPGMDGATFLARARPLARDTVRVLLTGQADVRAAIAAINDGRIFRFLCKPCPVDELRKTLRDAVEQYRFVTAEREILDQTLRGCVKALFGCLELASPQAFARAGRIRNLVAELCRQLEVGDAWEIEVAAMLAQLGAVTLPPDVIDRLEKGLPLPRAEQAMVDRAGVAVHRLLADIPRLAEVQEIIQAQYFPPPAASLHELPETVRVGIELLSAATDFEMNDARGMEPESAVAAIEAKGLHHPGIIGALRKIRKIHSDTETIKALPLHEITIDMRIVENVTASNGLVLIGRGTVVTEPLLDRLRNFKEQGNLVEPLMAAVPRAPAENAAPVDPADGLGSAA